MGILNLLANENDQVLKHYTWVRCKNDIIGKRLGQYERIANFFYECAAIKTGHLLSVEDSLHCVYYLNKDKDNFQIRFHIVFLSTQSRKTLASLYRIDII